MIEFRFGINNSIDCPYTPCDNSKWLLTDCTCMKRNSECTVSGIRIDETDMTHKQLRREGIEAGGVVHCVGARSYSISLYVYSILTHVPVVLGLACRARDRESCALLLAPIVVTSCGKTSCPLYVISCENGICLRMRYNGRYNSMQCDKSSYVSVM